MEGLTKNQLEYEPTIIIKSFRQEDNTISRNTTAPSSSNISPVKIFNNGLNVLEDLKTIVNLPESYSIVSSRILNDLEMILSDAFAPLIGFMNLQQYNSVIQTMHLPAGELFPVPIVLPIPINETRPIDNNNSQNSLKPIVLKLRDYTNTILAELTVENIFMPCLEKEMQSVFGTTDSNHPYIKYMKDNFENCFYVGGKVSKVQTIQHFDFPEYRLTPSDLKSELRKLNWENDAIIGFQVRNPMHRSHFEITKKAIKEVQEANPTKNVRLLITPAVGTTQDGDIDYRIRIRCYEEILKFYNNGVKLVILPLSMRMAGPKEALWHAIIRRNYGCTHFIVGRDHAGPSCKKKDGTCFYDPYQAHQVMMKYKDQMGILPVLGKEMRYLPGIGYVENEKIPVGMESFSLSGTELRNMLQEKREIPDWFSFPEVTKRLAMNYLALHKKGLCLYFTGLPCSGKSTLANAIEAKILEKCNDTRKITLLDADLIRRHLSNGLGFSREHRSQNVRRIGYVSMEVVKHGGICLVANIAPYSSDRQFNREVITSAGGHYVEVYVSTPLSVCEKRDVKELYKKARLNLIHNVTGIDDPYEVPEIPELIIDSSNNLNENINKIMDYLIKKNYIILL